MDNDMNIFKRTHQKIRKKIAKNEKAALIIYLVAFSLILISLIRQAIHGNYFNVLLCAFSLILASIPSRIEARTKWELPQTLEIIIICFVFAAEILGEIENFYFHIPIWDSLLHITTGFLAAAVAFAAIDLVNTHAKRIHMTPFFVVAVAFCFSMTIAVLWEFFEFGADCLIKTDMQKDVILSQISTVTLDMENANNPVIVDDIAKTIMYDKNGNILATIQNGYLDIGVFDTMKDMFVNMIGAVVFSVYGYLYLKKKDKYKFIEKIIISEQESVTL